MGAIWSSADGWLRRRPPGPMPQLEDGVRHRFKVSRFPDFWPYWGGGGNNPHRAQACARVPERGWSLGLFSSVFFSTSFKQKKIDQEGVL